MPAFHSNEGRFLNFYRSRPRVLSRADSIKEAINRSAITTALFYTARMHRLVVGKFLLLNEQLLLKRSINRNSACIISTNATILSNASTVSSFICQHAAMGSPAIFALSLAALTVAGSKSFNERHLVAYAHSMVYSRLQQQSTYNAIERSFRFATAGLRRLERRWFMGRVGRAKLQRLKHRRYTRIALKKLQYYNNTTLFKKSRFYKTLQRREFYFYNGALCTFGVLAGNAFFIDNHVKEYGTIRLAASQA